MASLRASVFAEQNTGFAEQNAGPLGLVDVWFRPPRRRRRRLAHGVSAQEVGVLVLPQLLYPLLYKGTSVLWLETGGSVRPAACRRARPKKYTL